MNAKSWTICLIEPSKFDRQVISDLLRNAGVDKVRVCENVEDADDLLEVYNANIIIAAFELGDQTAADWTRTFRRSSKAANRKASIFITSSAFSLSIAEKCRIAGANALIGKPISSKVLTQTIIKVLSNPRPWVEAEGYVGPCRRAGIVTAAGGPKRRRQADEAGGAQPLTLPQAVAALSQATDRYLADSKQRASCEAALRFVQAYAVNAGDLPLMRASAAFAQMIGARNVDANAMRGAVVACVRGVAQIAETDTARLEERGAKAESLHQMVSKALQLRAA